jgi:hypothetical protein
LLPILNALASPGGDANGAISRSGCKEIFANHAIHRTFLPQSFKFTPSNMHLLIT